MSPEERRLQDESIDRDAAAAAESERPLVAKIRAAGFDVDSIWDLVYSHSDHAYLAPVLLDNLSKEYQGGV